MGRIKDLAGQKFGKLLVLEITPERRNRQVVWKCQCDCGNITYVTGQALRSGHTQSCGCKNYENKNYIDLTGQVFGDLTVLIKMPFSSKDRHAIWECKCTCGNKRLVVSSKLLNHSVTKCQNCSSTIYNGIKNLQGKKFGKLTVLELTSKRDSAGRAIWKCQCECGNICNVSSLQLIQGFTSSCGCIKSKGEQQITNILLKNNVQFNSQYSFQDCLSPEGYPLIFDFAIMKNNQIIQLIEYDGIQHFYPIEFFGGEKGFKYRQKCDEIKNEYCKKHNIPLKRISYYQTIVDLEDLIINNVRL